jgi:LETM1 and EF-hand domain-containing protein 1
LLDLIQKTKLGKKLTTQDTLKIVTLFKDDITLENVRRAQLVNICRYMSMTAYGSDGYLRYIIRSKIKSIKTDDQLIQWEGVESLSKEELQAACEERGMRSMGLTMFGLQQQLRQWLDLSINRNVPLLLLILSRAMTISHSVETIEKVRSFNILLNDCLTSLYFKN